MRVRYETAKRMIRGCTLGSSGRLARAESGGRWEAGAPQRRCRYVLLAMALVSTPHGLADATEFGGHVGGGFGLAVGELWQLVGQVGDEGERGQRVG